MKKKRERPIRWHEAAGWLFAGAVFTFLFFELGFRAMGPIFDRTRPGGDARYTILCEGDSFTYGIGGRSFPQQLEQVLNERAGKRLFRAVNKGIPGLNTAMLADHLEAHYEQFRPQVAVVVIGENNSWNSIRISDPDQAASPRLRWEKFLLFSRVYKFLKVMTIGWDHETFHAADPSELDEVEQAAYYLTETEESIGLPGPDGEETEGDDEDEAEPAGKDDSGFSGIPEESRKMYARATENERTGRYEEAIADYEELARRHPGFVRAYTGLGAMYLRFNRFEEAIKNLEIGAALPAVSETEAAYFQLGWAYKRFNKPQEAERAWRTGLKKFPASRQIFQALAKLYYEQGDIWTALALKTETPAVAENLLYRYLVRLEKKHGRANMKALVSRSFLGDMRRIASLGKKYGVKTILSSYPDHAYPEVETAAREAGLAYVDFRPLFRKRFRNRSEYISADDCHCNTAGYGLMAETFADAVEKVLGALENGVEKRDENRHFGGEHK